MSIILASRSPRRQELLRLVVPEFRIETADIDETMDERRPAAEEVARVCALKAAEIAQKYPKDLIVAADTIVVLRGKILGKPRNVSEASEMLHLLSGQYHEVLTGLCVQQADRRETRVIASKIHFRPLSDAEIAAYIRTGEPMDKAGAYGIQGKASVFVDDLQGDYFSVMGLPLQPLCMLLRSFGVPVLDTCEMG